jgi:hypothetical protein
MDMICSTHGRDEKPEGKRPLRRPRLRWEDNIRLNLREIRWEVRDWMHPVQDRDQWCDLVNTDGNEPLSFIKGTKFLD